MSAEGSASRRDSNGDRTPSKNGERIVTSDPAASDADPVTPLRTRTYEWSDPHDTAGTASTLSGLEFLTRMFRGELPLPPILHTLGIDVVDVGDGHVAFGMTPAEWHYNPIGSVHGGALTTLADSALGCAVHTRLPLGVGYTSLDVNINFVRAATVASGRLLCEGKVVTLGRRVATARAEITDAAGRLVAHATTTCLIIRGD
jgi:uncharacterized protein (TIGR00369 family)